MHVVTRCRPSRNFSKHSITLTIQDEVERLGPVKGPLLFIVTVGAAEMIPLFPTQPLSLASGLLFGPIQVQTEVSASMSFILGISVLESSLIASASYIQHI